MATRTDDVRRWLLMLAFCTIFLLDALVVSAQIKVNDENFKTTPLTVSGANAKRSEIIKFIWGLEGFPSAKMPSSHQTLQHSPVKGLTNLDSVEALHISMELGQRTIAYH